MTSVTKAVVENHVNDDVGRQLSDISRQESNLSNISNLSNASVASELEKQQHEIEKQQSEIERQQQEMKKQQQEVERQQRELERQKSEMERQHREAMDNLKKEMLEMKMQMNQLKKTEENLKEQMEKRLDTSSEASNDPDEPHKNDKPKATTGHVDLTRISTYDTRLYMCGNMIVVPNTGDIVLYGKSSETDKLAYHIYHEVNEKLTHRMMKDTCDHDYYVRMLPVVVQGKNRLCVTCPGCKDVKLFSLHSGGCLPAFQDRKYTPYRMCHGQEGRVFMHSYSDPFPIVELDITEQEFSGPTQTLTSMGTWETWGMCYLPEPFNAVVLTDVNGGVIRAISYERDNVMWEIKGKVDDLNVDPRGVMFYPDHQVVLVCDGSNERILILNPKDGSHMQSIDLGMNASKQENKGRGMGKIMNISLYRDQAVVQHYGHKKFKVSFFDIK